MPQTDSSNFGPEEFASLAHVSHETLSRLKLYAEILADWNRRHNLVSRASLPDLWRRHFWDSAQLTPFVPEAAGSIVDLGTGAGFPGLVLAEMLRGRPSLRVILYEATAKKCAFLAAVAARLDLPVEIRNARIEDASRAPFDLVTARACAPLPRLLSYAHTFWGPATIGLFLKGQTVEAELTDAHKSWRMRSERIQSRSDRSGVILQLRELHRVAQ